MSKNKYKTIKYYRLVESIYNEDINKYIQYHPQICKPANYALKVDPNHWIYQKTYKNMLWYIHYDPYKELLFKICVYVRTSNPGDKAC